MRGEDAVAVPFLKESTKAGGIVTEGGRGRVERRGSEAVPTQTWTTAEAPSEGGGKRREEEKGRGSSC